MRWTTILALMCALVVRSAAAEVETGAVKFAPNGDQQKIPKRYRLQEQRFDYKLEKFKDYKVSGVEVYRLQFPSPVKSSHPENNTVHAEYYRPKGKGPFPGVIVLDITGGNQDLSRIFAKHLAQNKIAGLFVQMAYYGPRRPKGKRVRLLSPDIQHTIRAVRQTVLDMRYAAAWLESRPEIDEKRLGIMGTSLGSFIAALTSEMEPKLGRVAILLGGGGFVDAYYDHPKAKTVVMLWELIGGTKKQVADLIAPVDPLTRADLLCSRKVLMVAAKHDQIVPPKMATSLWQASGKQKIVWLNAGHYSAALYLVPCLNYLVEHFRSK